MTGFEDKIQWLADNIDRILLVLTNLISIGVAIYNWYKKIKITKAAKSLARGVHIYANMPNCENSKVKDQIFAQAADSRTMCEVENLMKK